MVRIWKRILYWWRYRNVPAWAADEDIYQRAVSRANQDKRGI